MEVEWIGHLGIPSGYGTASMHYVEELNNMVDLKCTTLDRNMYMYGWMEKLAEKKLDNPVKVTHAIPNEIPDSLGDACYTVFEFHQAPEEWERKLEDVHFVFTPSEYSKESLSTVCDKDKIKVINHGVSPEFNPYGGKVEFAKSRTIKWKNSLDMPSFKFLSVFEWVERKCPDRLIQAFCEEFDVEEDVCLILKTDHYATPVRRMIKKLAGNNNVYHFRQFVTDISNLYRGANAYISVGPEGWGETLSEAMACGMPTIGPNWSGTTEFMNSFNSFQIEPDDAIPIKYNKMEAIVKPWFTYQPPKIDSIRSNMRAVYEENCENIDAITRNAVQDMQEFTWEKATSKMVKYLEELR